MLPDYRPSHALSPPPIDPAAGAADTEAGAGLRAIAAQHGGAVEAFRQFPAIRRLTLQQRACDHMRVVPDEATRMLNCQGCGIAVDAFSWAFALATREDRLSRTWEQYARRAEESVATLQRAEDELARVRLEAAHLDAVIAERQQTLKDLMRVLQEVESAPGAATILTHIEGELARLAAAQGAPAVSLTSGADLARPRARA